jgi:S1-C subfamily serine protease
MTEHVTCPKCRHAFPLPQGDGLAVHGQESVCKPAETAENTPHEANSPFDVGLSGESARKPLHRPKSPLAKLVRLAAVVAAFAALAATGAVLVMVQAQRRPAETRASAPAPRSNSAQATGAARSGESSTADNPPLSQVIRNVSASVVKIESVGASQQALGCGFVVDRSGLIATNFHVTSSAVRGRVRFQSGAVYDIAGYAAVDPENDLAILRLRDAPATLVPLPLRAQGSPEAMTPVVAIGHPQGMEFSPFDGRVSKVVDTADLPEDSRQFLRRHMNSLRNHRWIQHTAGTSEGNSGGPLVNLRGEVVGINTWVSTDTNYSYALHVRYLAELLSAVSDETIPLERFASGAARSEAELEQLAPGRLAALFDQAGKMRWRPEDESDYEVLSRLAAVMTIASRADEYAAGQIDAQLREQLILEADQIQQQLRGQRWSDVGQMTIINEFASQRVGRPMTGLFCFGTVEDVFRGDADTKGMLVRLAGGEETLFISLTGSLVVPERGAHCLILGISTGRSVRYGDNPLKLESAAEVVSRTIVTLR